MVCKEYITVQLIRSSVGPKRITKKNNSMYRIHLKALKMADFSLLHLNFIQTSGLISCGTDSHVVSSDRPQYFLSHLNFIQTSGLISCGTDSHVVSSDRPQYFLYAAILNQQSQSHSRGGFPLLLWVFFNNILRRERNAWLEPSIAASAAEALPILHITSICSKKCFHYILSTVL